MLSVARTDLMRVVILVPDLDVPFVDPGDPATIRVDALAGRCSGARSRGSPTPRPSKLMRTEVDLPNPDNRLRDGMYGTATPGGRAPLEEPDGPLDLPDRAGRQGEGAVYVVRAGKVHRQAVRVAADNGQETEIVEGLPRDQVIVRYKGSIAEGLAVTTTLMKTDETRGNSGAR